MKILLVILFAVLCACSPVPSLAKLPGATAAPQEVQATPLMESATPEATATAEATYTPDAPATAQAERRSDAATADWNMVLIEREKANGKAAELLVENSRATNSAENRAAAATAQIGQLETIRINATGTADGQIFAARVPTLIAAGTASQYTQAHEVTGIALQWVAILVALVLAAVCLLWLMLRVRNMTEPEPEPEYDDEPTAPTVHFVQGDTINPVPPPPGDYQSFLEWARVARQGASLAYNVAVGAGKPYSSNGAYYPVWEWAHKYKIVERQPSGRAVLSKRGEDYCDEALRDSDYKTPSPRVDDTQIVTPAAHGYDNMPMTGGGAEVDD